VIGHRFPEIDHRGAVKRSHFLGCSQGRFRGYEVVKGRRLWHNHSSRVNVNRQFGQSCSQTLGRLHCPIQVAGKYNLQFNFGSRHRPQSEKIRNAYTPGNMILGSLNGLGNTHRQSPKSCIELDYSSNSK
jgi:hypothetical protein